MKNKRKTRETGKVRRKPKNKNHDRLSQNNPFLLFFALVDKDPIYI